METILLILGVTFSGVGAAMIGRIGTIRRIVNDSLRTKILKTEEINIISEIITVVVYGIFVLALGILFICGYLSVR